MSKEHRLKPQKNPTENKARPLSFLLGWSRQALLEHLRDQAAQMAPAELLREGYGYYKQ